MDIAFAKAETYHTVVHQVSFDLFSDEILAIVGESGSGKSVTTRALMGLLPEHTTRITGKQIAILGRNCLNPDGTINKVPAHLRGKNTALVFQEPMSSLNPTITCGEQVAEVYKRHTRYSRRKIHNEVIQLFKNVKLPEPETLYKKYPHQISGGQMQRVMIAMALATDPEILICDEPTTALDVTVQKEIILLIKNLQQKKRLSVIFISHDLDLVGMVADRIAVMYKGKIVETGSTTDIFHNPQNAYTRALIAVKPDLEQTLERLPTIKDIMAGKMPVKKANTSEHFDPKLLVNVKNVTKQFTIPTPLFQAENSFTAVDRVSFDIYQGENLGLVGESGCGKSTLGNMIAGLLKPDEGSIHFRGQNLQEINKVPGQLAKKIQIIFQDPFASLNPKIKVGDAICEPLLYHKLVEKKKEAISVVRELLVKVGLEEEDYGKYPHQFSGGQRQRIGIARSIVLRPDLIVCDESVSALDVSVQAQILNLLQDLQAEFGFTYLFISHDLSTVRHFCDRVIVMNRGRIEELASAREIFERPTKGYTKTLLSSIPKFSPS